MLEFEITKEDLVAYTLHGLGSAESVRRQNATFRVWLSLAVLIALTLMNGLGDSWVEGVVAGLVGGAILWFVWPMLWTWTTERNVLRHAKSGVLGTPGPCRIWLDEFGVHDATPTGTSSVSWAGIDRVEENDAYVYVFVAPLQAYIIPKRIGEPAVRAFADEVRARAARSVR